MLARLFSSGMYKGGFGGRLGLFPTSSYSMCPTPWLTFPSHPCVGREPCLDSFSSSLLGHHSFVPQRFTGICLNPGHELDTSPSWPPQWKTQTAPQSLNALQEEARATVLVVPVLLPEIWSVSWGTDWIPSPHPF